MAVWNATTAVSTDTSTPDLVASTFGISFTVGVAGGQVGLSAVVTTGTWDVTAGARVIF
jgi:hypothetical protein